MSDGPGRLAQSGIARTFSQDATALGFLPAMEIVFARREIVFARREIVLARRGAGGRRVVRAGMPIGVVLIAHPHRLLARSLNRHGFVGAEMHRLRYHLHTICGISTNFVRNTHFMCITPRGVERGGSR
jgi:hypothetical protein